MDLSFLVNSLAVFAQHAAPFLPAALAVPAAYLVADDVLDCALVAKKLGKRAKFSDFVNAVLSDVTSVRALAAVALAEIPVLLAGGDQNALVAAAVAAVAVANATDGLKASVKNKLAALLS